MDVTSEGGESLARAARSRADTPHVLGSSSMRGGPYFTVEARVRPYLALGSVRVLRRRVRRAASAMGIERAALEELGIKLCAPVTMARLNLDFRDARGSTDVLSFPSEALDGSGDLALDWLWVRRQAAHFGRSPVDEGALLLAHGLAHLLGHDHAARSEARRMLRCEQRGLRAMHVADGWRPYPRT